MNFQNSQTQGYSPSILKHVTSNAKGFNFYQAKKLCNNLGINYLSKVDSLSERKLDQLNRELAQVRKIENYQNSLGYPPIGINLIKYHNQAISRLININSHRGRRLKLGLPARGQRTRSNSKNASKKFAVSL